MISTPPSAATQTIFAPATGSGRSAIAIIRIAGPASGQIVGAMCSLPPPRTACLRNLRNSSGELLDQGLVLWFPGPQSYTGDDSAELHLHGGRAVLQATTDALIELGARPAEPGEFTRRAVLAGRMDLLDAEAVADLVDAETSEQRAQALRQIGGEQSRLLQDWASRLLHGLSLQEAMIDFAEEDLPDLEAEMLEILRRLDAELSEHAVRSMAGERLRRGLVFAITGPPNAGKSSLLNALCGRDAAIVAATPGTTRDPISVETIMAGIPVTLVDTAGLRETDDPVEAEGVARARNQSATADLVIMLADASADGPGAAVQGPLLVANKIDLAPAPSGFLGISVRSGMGMAELSLQLEAAARQLCGTSGSAIFARARHRAALADAGQAVSAALVTDNAELRAEELRSALQALGRLRGQVGSEEVLDMIFSTFCIGK